MIHTPLVLKLRAAPLETLAVLFGAQQAIGNAAQAAAADPVGRVVTEQRSKDRRDNYERDVEVTLGGQHGGGDDHCLAREHRKHGVARDDGDEQHIGPGRPRDDARDRIEHLRGLPVRDQRNTLGSRTSARAGSPARRVAAASGCLS
jgi:hypothetical protein